MSRHLDAGAGGDAAMNETASALVESVAAHPDWHASAHARALGITRERVRQLRIELGLNMPRKLGGIRRPWPRPLCFICSKPLSYLHTTRHRSCPLPSKYGVPARTREYARLWARDHKKATHR